MSEESELPQPGPHGGENPWAERTPLLVSRKFNSAVLSPVFKCLTGSCSEVFPWNLSGNKVLMSFSWKLLWRSFLAFKVWPRKHCQSLSCRAHNPRIGIGRPLFPSLGFGPMWPECPEDPLTTKPHLEQGAALIPSVEAILLCRKAWWIFWTRWARGRHTVMTTVSPELSALRRTQVPAPALLHWWLFPQFRMNSCWMGIHWIKDHFSLRQCPNLGQETLSPYFGLTK